MTSGFAFLLTMQSPEDMTRQLVGIEASDEEKDSLVETLAGQETEAFNAADVIKSTLHCNEQQKAIAIGRLLQHNRAALTEVHAAEYLIAIQHTQAILPFLGIIFYWQ